MIRCFCYLRRNRTLIEDDEGGEFEGLEEALAEALKAAKELVINSIRTGQPIDGDLIEIWNEGIGKVGEVRLLDVIPFRRQSPDAG